jgi:hypothetical protein
VSHLPLGNIGRTGSLPNFGESLRKITYFQGTLVYSTFLFEKQDFLILELAAGDISDRAEGNIV